MIKLNLMFRERGFDLEAKTCYGRSMLNADLELERILSAMSRGDSMIFSVCGVALFSPLVDSDELSFRRRNLEDARKNSAAVRKLYDVVMGLETVRQSGWRPFANMSILSIYRQAHEIFRAYVAAMELLYKTVHKDAGLFTSDGFFGLYSRLKAELSPEFMSELKRHTNEMENPESAIVSAELGDILHGVNYTLLRSKSRTSWLKWRLAPSYSFNMADNYAMQSEEFADIDNRRDRAIRDTANALCKAVKYLESFFDALRVELAFYIGCLNLEETVAHIGLPMCVPDMSPVESRDRSWGNLYDLALALLINKSVVGNTLTARDKKLYVITGANQGGKSTFLRSIGQAQLMAQCGMPVAAENAVIPLRRGLFTHFKREEDSSMKSGKLDEELVRLSEAVEYMEPGSMLLLNESFGSTNEREGSEICRQITTALTDSGVEIFSVSHMYMYANSFEDSEDVQFLRAQRKEDGSRTFKLEPGQPLETAFGVDLYDKIIGA